jgi:hypothetical protein
MRSEDKMDGVYSTQTFPPFNMLCKIIIIIFSSYFKCVYDYIVLLLLAWLDYVVVLLSTWLCQGYLVRYILGTDDIRYTQ